MKGNNVYKKSLLFLCIVSNLFSADKPNDRILWFADKEELSVSADQIKGFPFFENMLGGGRVIPMEKGSVSTMESILKGDFNNKTTKELVDIIDLIDYLYAPIEAPIEVPISLLELKFQQQSQDIARVFDAQGDWAHQLKQKCAALLPFLYPFNKLENFTKHNTVGVGAGFRLKGCSCQGTYALVSRKDNFREKSVKIIATDSGKILSDFKVRKHIAFSDFHDSLLLCRDDRNQTIEFIDCLALDKKEVIDLSQAQILEMYAHSLAPDANTIAIGGIRSLVLFDRKDKKVQKERGMWGKSISLKYTLDGKFLVTVEKVLAKDSENLFLLDAHTLDPLWGGGGFKVPGFKDLAISPDDKKIVVVRKEKVVIISLKDHAPIATALVTSHARGERAFYCNDIPLCTTKTFGKDCLYLNLIPCFGGVSMYCGRKVLFSSNEKLLCEINPGEICVYDTNLKMQKATLKELPLSLFHILSKGTQQPVDPGVVAAHVKVLEDLRPKICSADRKIIDGLLERLGKKTSCTVS